MSEKSMAQMADEILGGALTDTTKNPYDPIQGHQSSMPAMDPKDRLLEMNDNQRAELMGVAGISVQEEVIVETKEETPAPPTSLELTAQELETLSEAKRIIEKIQEMTSVGNIGVNMAGGAKGDAKKVKLPGPDYEKPAPKKRTKKKVKTEATDSFLSYLKA
jgi:hypothetical protein